MSEQVTMTDSQRRAALNEKIAREVFGWRWIAYTGTPVRGTPGYPEKCTVRQFVPTRLLKDKRWKVYFAEIGGYTDATGDEPLDYCYCSSRGPSYYGDFIGTIESHDELTSSRGWAKVAGEVAEFLQSRGKK